MSIETRQKVLGALDRMANYTERVLLHPDHAALLGRSIQMERGVIETALAKSAPMRDAYKRG